jgi:hypothetical protein
MTDITKRHCGMGTPTAVPLTTLTNGIYETN